MEKLHKKGITDKKMNFRYTTRKQEYTNQQNPVFSNAFYPYFEDKYRIV